MFWRAALGLPFFALRWHSLRLADWARVHGAGSTDGASSIDGAGGTDGAAAAAVVVAGVALPRMYLLLAGNVVCDYATKRAMTRLIGEASALTATMLITLQRFVSLLFSATVTSR